MAEHLLSIQEVSKALGVHIETLRRWDASGKLVPVRTPGGHRRYRQSDIDAFMGTANSDSAEGDVAEPVIIRQRVRKPDNRVTIKCSEELAKGILELLQKVVEGSKNEML